MVRKSLLVATLLAVAAPLSAQEDVVWSSKRPDGHAPLGVWADRTMDSGEFEVSYRFHQLNSKGVWFDTDSLFLEETLEFYPVAPLSLENMTHVFSVAYAPTSTFTVLARAAFSQRERQQLTDAGVLYLTNVEELGDMEVTGLYNFLDQDGFRAHVQLGGLIPTGTSDVVGETPFSSPGQEALPYDMRPGAGTFALLPGMTVQAQNEDGTVGAQIKGSVFFGTNSEGYTQGDRTEFNVWAARRLGDYISVSGRVHYQRWGRIEGQDSRLDPLRDPGNDAFFLEGERMDLPIGLNFFLPEGSRFAGHRLAVEYVFPVHQKYDGPQLGAEWGLVIGWQMVW